MEIGAIFQLLKDLIGSLHKVFAWLLSRQEETEKRNRSKDGAALLDRFLLVFETQGVPRPLIPRFAGAEHLLSIQHACSDDMLATALTDELVQLVANRFGLAPGWLYGATETSYPLLSHYKNPGEFVEEVIGLLQKAKEQARVAWDELLFISNGRVPQSLEEQHDSELRVAILLRCQLDEIEGIDVERVHVLEDDLPWGHAPARLYLKEVALLAMHLGIAVRGITCSHKEFAAFEKKRLLPHQLAFHRAVSWHPDDYVVRQKDSVVAKQVEEGEIVRARIEPAHIQVAVRGRRTLGRHDVYKGVL